MKRMTTLGALATALVLTAGCSSSGGAPEQAGDGRDSVATDNAPGAMTTREASEMSNNMNHGGATIQSASMGTDGNDSVATDNAPGAMTTREASETSNNMNQGGATARPDNIDGRDTTITDNAPEG